MSITKFTEPVQLGGRKNWVEQFFPYTADLLQSFGDGKGRNGIPATNVREEADAFLLEVAVPGMKKEDLQVELTNGVLSIHGTSREQKEESEDQYRRQEFNYTHFDRSFWLPENINAEKIGAICENGILRLRLPKVNTTPSVKSKMIKIT